MTFCTAVNCMDGRVQLPVINYLMERFDVEYVDSVTEPGPVRVLSDAADPLKRSSVFDRVTVSTGKHGSNLIAVVAHFDCTGNPLSEDEQMRQLERSVDVLAAGFPDAFIVGLWVDAEWTVSERLSREPAR